MNLVLVRNKWSFDGVFGEINDQKGNFLFVTLEHAYPLEDGFTPKIPAGKYTCLRGMHRLAHMEHEFETFQILNVPGHTNVLFHMGNWNKDSDGCILVGKGMGKLINGGDMIMGSLSAFRQFMSVQTGIDTFTLTVE